MWSRSASFSRFASSARRSSPRTSSSVGSRASASAMKLARSSTVESFSPGERSPGKIHAGLESAATPDAAKSGERGALAGVAAPDATLGESARVPKGVLGVFRGFSRVPEGAGLGESTAADVDFTRRVNGVRSSFPTRDGRLAPAERDAEGADDADRVAPPARPGVADPPISGGVRPPTRVVAIRRRGCLCAARRRASEPRHFTRQRTPLGSLFSRFCSSSAATVVRENEGKRGVRGRAPSFLRARVSAPRARVEAALCPRAVPACDITRPFEHVAPSRARVAVLRAADFRRRGGSRHPRFRLRGRPPRESRRARARTMAKRAPRGGPSRARRVSFRPTLRTRACARAADELGLAVCGDSCVSLRTPFPPETSSPSSFSPASFARLPRRPSTASPCHSSRTPSTART